jgi:hypothetical protein
MSVAQCSRRTGAHLGGPSTVPTNHPPSVTWPVRAAVSAYRATFDQPRWRRATGARGTNEGYVASLTEASCHGDNPSARRVVDADWRMCPGSADEFAATIDPSRHRRRRSPDGPADLATTHSTAADGGTHAEPGVDVNRAAHWRAIANTTADTRATGRAAGQRVRRRRLRPQRLRVEQTAGVEVQPRYRA